MAEKTTPTKQSSGGRSVDDRKIEYVTIALITLVAGVLILANLGNQCLWQDEAQTALIARTVLAHGIPLGTDGKNSFSQDLGKDYGRGHVWRLHPWFPFYLLAGFFAVLGQSTFVCRLPFALFGIGTILLTYCLARRMFQARRTAVMAAGLLALCVPFVVLMRQCKYHAPDAFFSVLALYGYYGLLQRRRYAGVAFFVGAVLLFHTQYAHCAALLGAVAAHSLLLRRDRLRAVLMLSAAVVAVCLPWLVWFSGAGQIVRSEGSRATRILTSAWAYLYQAGEFVFPPAMMALLALVAAVSWKRRRPVPRLASQAAQDFALLIIFILFNIAAVSVASPAPFFRYLAPVIPAVCLVMALLLESAMKIHVAIGAAALAALVYFSPMSDYLYEITHDYTGPMDGIVRYIRSNAKPGDVVAITYEDLPVKFYTNLRVIGGLTGEDLSPALRAKWVIVRRNVICEKDLAVARYLSQHLVPSDYEPEVIDCPDIPWENREDPAEHQYRTVEDAPSVVIYRRVVP